MKNLIIISVQMDKLVNKKSLIIAFIGPDGVGKTTIAKNLLKSEIVENLFLYKYYFYMNFSILPYLRKIANILIFFRQSKKTKDVNLKDINPLPLWKAVIWPIYYGLNYILGHIWVWIHKKKGPILVVFDRYFYEYLINIQFARCPRWLLFFIEKFIVKPDLLIFLKAPADAIYKRKIELPINEIRRQLDECEKIIKRYKNGYIVNTYRTLEETLEDINQIILKKLDIG